MFYLLYKLHTSPELSEVSELNIGAFDTLLAVPLWKCTSLYYMSKSIWSPLIISEQSYFKRHPIAQIHTNTAS